jgi:putative aldouronate transport system permease protein
LFRKIHLKDSYVLLLIALPGLLHFLIFKYIPILGNVIAFQEYNLFSGILHSKWVGFDQFIYMFQYPEFFQILRNSLILGIYSILFGFPAPIVIVLLINEIRMIWFQRVSQTILYLPHFLSWVIVGGIFTELLSAGGFANQILGSIGIPPISFLTDPKYFIGMLVSLGMWKEIGWQMIIYLAALAGVNPHLYEAAMVDGAGRWRRMWSVSIPCLMPAIVVLLLLRVGHLLDANIEQVLFFLNPLVREVGDVFDTYVYRVGLVGGKFSYTTAIGIFKSVVGIIMIIAVNKLSKKTTGESIY